MTLLTESEFKQCLTNFIDVSNDIKDTWELLTFEEQNEEKQYLVKRNVTRLLDHPHQNSNEETELQFDADLELDKDEIVNELGSSITLCTYEYHIIYSHSYSVPVLYFNACKPDGQLLSLDEVWQMVPEHYKRRLQHERWTFITQQEHPILGRPFFLLHPCHTGDLVKALSANSTPIRSYLVSWLSSVGPVVGIDLSLAFAKLC